MAISCEKISVAFINYHTFQIIDTRLGRNRQNPQNISVTIY